MGGLTLVFKGSASQVARASGKMEFCDQPLSCENNFYLASFCSFSSDLTYMYGTVFRIFLCQNQLNGNNLDFSGVYLYKRGDFMRRTRLSKRKGKFFGMVMEFNTLIFTVTALIFAFGTVCGIFMLNGVSNAEFGRLLRVWETAAAEDYKNGFFESFFKYGAAVLGIWICGFFKIGIIGMAVIIFTKGAGVGFTSAFIIKCMGDTGVFMIFRLCFFRDFFTIFLCFIAVMFSVRRYADKRNFREDKFYYIFGAGLFVGVAVLCALV